ncbi:hypothetical protein Tco_0130229 [Tanacetum coccineum]
MPGNRQLSSFTSLDLFATSSEMVKILIKCRKNVMHVFLLGILLSQRLTSSDPGPQCSTTVLEQESLSPDSQSQENVSQTTKTETTSNELELLYSPMFSELLNGTSLVVSKSSAVHAADN